MIAASPAQAVSPRSSLSPQGLWRHANSIVEVSTYPSDLAALLDTQIIEGTGFFIAGGDIVTCYHVISHAHVYIDVTMRNNPAPHYQGRVYHAHVVATDLAQDLAILALDNHWDAPPLPLGNPGRLRVGSRVAVFGHEGGGPLRVQMGIYEGRVARELVDTYGVLHNMLAMYDKTEPGDSGSPIFGLGGSVIGVDESYAGHWAYAAVPITALHDIVGATERTEAVNRGGRLRSG